MAWGYRATFFTVWCKHLYAQKFKLYMAIFIPISFCHIFLSYGVCSITQARALFPYISRIANVILILYNSSINTKLKLLVLGMLL